MHIKPETMKFIEEKVGKKILNRTEMARAVRSRINKWDLIKLQSFCRQRTLLIGKKGNQQIEKRSLPILHGTEG